MNGSNGVRVYWAARNFHRWWSPGNHHFILIRTTSPVGIFPVVRHNGDGFITLGAFNHDDVVTFKCNQHEDVQVFKNIISQAPDWESWEPMLKHKVSREGKPFAEELARACMKFRSNTTRRPVPYELLGDDCAPWIIALLDTCGISSAERQRIGNLASYPAQYRLSFPRDMFQKFLTPTEPRQPGQPCYHIVEKDDWLSKIAITYYGDMKKWPIIFDANRDKISDPDRIYPGQRLLIP